jgi:secreted trypsin-like serine protease
VAVLDDSPALVALAGGVVALIGCSAPPSEATGTTSSAITDGQPDVGDPAVALLMQGSGLSCSATLIAPQVLLTAAHCLTGSAPTAAHFGTTPDDDGATIPVARVVAHPEFDPDTYVNDVGVVLLLHPSTAPVAARATRPLDASLVNQQVRLVGWGLSASTGGTRAKRSGSTNVVTETDLDFQFVAAPSSTCFGDSGGAAFATIDGVEVLVGVTSTGDPACSSGGDMRVDAYAGFIAPFVSPPAPVGGGGCAVAFPASSGAASWLLLAVVGVVRRARRRISTNNQGEQS